MPSFETKDVQLAKRGDQEAFIRLIRSSEESMYRIAKAIVKTDADCADAMQEAILKAYHSIGSLREIAFFKTWLLRILINQCKEMVRRRAKVVPMQEFLERGQEAPYERVELQEAVDSLSEELRLLVTLYYFEDVPVKEIAAMLGLPDGTVKSKLARARQQLARFFGEEAERHEG